MITLPETLQKIFNIVAVHLMTQMEKCENKSEQQCLYRFGTLKCAAGALIKDEEYSEELERKSWQSLVNYGLAPKEFSRNINHLQNIHDGHDPREWKEKLIEFAGLYGLDKPECLA